MSLYVGLTPHTRLSLMIRYVGLFPCIVATIILRKSVSKGQKPTIIAEIHRPWGVDSGELTDVRFFPVQSPAQTRRAVLSSLLF